MTMSGVIFSAVGGGKWMNRPMARNWHSDIRNATGQATIKALAAGFVGGMLAVWLFT